MAGKRRRRPVIVINGAKMFNAKRTAEALEMNEQHLRRLANQHKIPGHLEGKQWFFDIERVKKAQAERFGEDVEETIEENESRVIELEPAVKVKIKISRKDILDDPLAGF